MTRRPSTYSMLVHTDAQLDLELIQSHDSKTWAEIVVFLEEVKDSHDTLDNFSRHGYVEYSEYVYEVQELAQPKRDRYNLWRIKFLESDSKAKEYRIIYAFHPQALQYHVLGVLKREIAYEFTHPRTCKIFVAYNELDLPRL